MKAGVSHAELETEALWTSLEDEAVLQCVAEFGLSRFGSSRNSSSWAATARRLPGRSDRSIRNRWLTLQDPRLRGGRPPPPHDPEPAPRIAPSPPTHGPADGNLKPTSFDGGLNGGHRPGWQPVWVVSLVVPANWLPGRKLAVTLEDGGRLVITPPDDATPGMPLKFQVPASDSASMRGASPATRTYSREAEATTPPSSASNWGAERPQSVELGPKSQLSDITTGLSTRNSLRLPKRDAYYRDAVLSSVRSPPAGTLERHGGAFRAKQDARARARTLPAMEKSKEAQAALLGQNSKLFALSARAIAGDRDTLCGGGHVPRVLAARACPTCGLNRSYSMHSLPSMCADCLRAARVQARCRAVPGVRHPLLKPKAVSTPGLNVAGRACDAAARDAARPVEANDPRRAQSASARHSSASGAPQTKRQRSEASPGTAGGLLRGKHMKTFLGAGTASSAARPLFDAPASSRTGSRMMPATAPPLLPAGPFPQAAGRDSSLLRP